MTSPPAQAEPSARVAASLEALNAVGGRLLQLLKDHDAADLEIRTTVSTDRGLSAEGRQDMLRRLRASLTERSRDALDQLRSDVDQAVQNITKRVNAQLPKPMPGVEGMLGRQAAWSRSRSLLETGMRATALIDECTDVETLHALAAELPTWTRAHGATPDTAEMIRHRIDLRLAKVAGARVEADLLALHEANVIVGSARLTLDQAENRINGVAKSGDGLTAAINARIAKGDLRSYWSHVANGDIGGDAA